tara:strand:+ start:475 stop:669 length:195 start_codon:yes stop_codon:yes gene_type:complete
MKDQFKEEAIEEMKNAFTFADQCETAFLKSTWKDDKRLYSLIRDAMFHIETCNEVFDETLQEEE